MQTQRIYAFDYLKGFIIFLVVAHHSAFAYTTFAKYNFTNYLYSTAPIVDSTRSIYLDFFQEFNDTFFMSLMFFIAGIFSWPSLIRKGWLRYLHDRFLRLGIPFICGVLFITPLAEYFSFIATGNLGSYWFFWFNVYFQNQWIPGPPWFLWVLLMFSIFLILIWYSSPSLLPSLSAIVERAVNKPIQALFFFALIAFVVYLIPYLIIPRGNYNSWISLAGPLWLQSNRIFFYALFFFTGVVAGSSVKLVKYLALWIVFSLGFYCVQWFGIGYAFQTQKVYIVGVQVLYCLLFALIATFTSAALIALFNRFFNKYSKPWNFLAENAYGVYLLHYPYVIALQYLLLGFSCSALIKFFIVVCVAFVASLLTSFLLRSIPGAKKIL
jgi:glucan biosynthesis protein C